MVQSVTHGIGGLHHMSERRNDLIPVACFEATVGINPQLLRCDHMHGLVDQSFDFSL